MELKFPLGPMPVTFHAHVLERLAERGATQDEIVATVEFGERFPAKLGRSGFRRNFPSSAPGEGVATALSK